MKTTNNISERVAELSATLAPMEKQPYTESAYDEMWGEANDFICYNSPYYYNGLQRVDFDGGINTCVLQSVEEYQVIRFFDVNVYMSGEQMLRYYSNEFENQEDPNWMDDDFYEPDELEIKGFKEYRQVWIDREGNVEIVDIEQVGIADVDCFVKVESLQDWVCEPKASHAILANINEYKDFCYTSREEPAIGFYLSQSAEYVRNNEPVFYDVAVANNLCDEIQTYYRTIRICHRHGYILPTDYQSIRRYFDYLRLLGLENENYLTQPVYVCPVDFDEAYNRIDHHRHELLVKEEKRKAQEKEEAFAEQHSWLFGIEFEDEHFHYKSLDSVEAYRVEGDIMHHCIYRCAYYSKPYFLAMHITDFEGNRVATCTVDLQRRCIDQIQPMCDDIGFYNTYGIPWKTTNDYKYIWNTLMARMHTFPKRRPVNKPQAITKVA